MRLINAPIGIFRFDGELVLKTEYYSENKQSGKYIPDCYIVRTGEYFWGGAKTANELINLDVEPVDFAELLSTVTDTISRQAAINELERAKVRVSLAIARQPTHSFERVIGRGTIGTLDDVEKNIRELPPAEPKRGKWIRDGHHIRCDQCGIYMCDTDREGDKIPNNFCPNCGMKMEEKQNDQ